MGLGSRAQLYNNWRIVSSLQRKWKLKMVCYTPKRSILSNRALGTLRVSFSDVGV